MTRQSPLDPGPAKSDAEADPVAALMQMLEALPDQDTAPKSEPEPVNSQIDLRYATPPDATYQRTGFQQSDLDHTSRN